MRETFFDGAFSPREVFFADAFFPDVFDRFGELQQPVSRIGAAVEDDVFHMFEQVFGDLFVDFQLPRVDDAHVKARFDRVVKEGCVDRFTDDIVAAETEADVGHAAGNFCTGAKFFDLFGGFEKIHGVVVVLFHAGGDSQNVRVKDNVLWWETNFIDQQIVGALADLYFVVGFDGLTRFVKRHHNSRSAITSDKLRPFEKFGFAFLEADRVHDCFALNGFEARFDDGPFGTVDHHRNRANVGLTCDQTQVCGHGLFAVEQCVIHVDVDHCGAALDLIARDIDGLFEMAFTHKPREFARSGNVGTLSHHEEICVRA